MMPHARRSGAQLPQVGVGPDYCNPSQGFLWGRTRQPGAMWCSSGLFQVGVGLEHALCAAKWHMASPGSRQVPQLCKAVHGFLRGRQGGPEEKQGTIVGEGESRRGGPP